MNFDIFLQVHRLKLNICIPVLYHNALYLLGEFCHIPLHHTVCFLFCFSSLYVTAGSLEEHYLTYLYFVFDTLGQDG